MEQWQIEYTKRFLKDLAKLPSNVQSRIEAIVFQPSLSTNPFGSGHIEKMQGYSDKYKIRMGQYRVGLTIDNETQMLIFERVAHRREIYRIFP
jgi:mRNA interferase RelE/StbE